MQNFVRVLLNLTRFTQQGRAAGAQRERGGVHLRVTRSLARSLARSLECRAARTVLPFPRGRRRASDEQRLRVRENQTYRKRVQRETRVSASQLRPRIEPLLHDFLDGDGRQRVRALGDLVPRLRGL